MLIGWRQRKVGELIIEQKTINKNFAAKLGFNRARHADRIAGLIHSNGAQLSAIGDVSEAALDNMEKLRSRLPVIASAAKDVTSNIGNAGRAAQAQLQDMINGFKTLNEFGVASERQ